MSNDYRKKDNDKIKKKLSFCGKTGIEAVKKIRNVIKIIRKFQLCILKQEYFYTKPVIIETRLPVENK